jgi:hypothetical protein
MEIGLAPGHRVPAGHKLQPLPAASVAAYETKPLPPIPTRRSGISSFSTEIQNAFRTPSNVNYQIPEVEQDLRGASIAVILDTDSDTTEQGPKIDNGDIFTEAAVQDVHSLLPTGSVQKLLQITGAGSAASLALTNTSVTPSGHNPAHKVKQIMGVEVPLDESHGSRPSAQQISPLTLKSRSSSIYSQDQGDAVSELDIASHEREQLSAPETSVTVSNHIGQPGFWSPGSVAPSAVPASLHIVKTDDRNTFGQGLAPLSEPASPTTNNYSYANGAFRQDLYHATVAELAQSTYSSACSQTSGNSDQHESTDFSDPGIYSGQPAQRESSFSNRSYRSKVRIGPPLRKLDTLIATRYNSPIKTPYPLGRSKFDFDDDDHTPTQKDYDSGVSPKTPTTRPSLIDRIIRRTPSSLSPADQFMPPPELTPTAVFTPSGIPSPLHLKPPPRLEHRPVKSHDSLRSHTPTVFANASTIYTPPTSRTVNSLHQDYTAQGSRPATPIAHTHTRPPPIPPRNPPPPSTRLTNPDSASRPSLAEAAAKNLAAWAERTAERLEQARQAAGIRTRSERRRARLKSKITVMGPGRLVAAPAPDSELERHSDERATPRARKAGSAPLVVGRGFEKYSDERAWAAVRNMI